MMRVQFPPLSPMNSKITIKFVDTAGQITAVVCNSKNRNSVFTSRKIMMTNKNIDQVVFIRDKSIETMGNELCINGSLAAAFLIKSNKTKISGLEKNIKFSVNQKSITGFFPETIVQSITKNIVLLSGIGYYLTKNNISNEKCFLEKLSKKYGMPAFGIVYYSKSKIKPVVYVSSTDTIISEKACGSGSLAYYLYSGIKNIKQPSGKIISIQASKKTFTIKVPVKILK